MDIDGPNATTSNIIGTYDYDSYVLTFTEDKVLSSKAPLDGDFCFISADASLSIKKKKSHLSGEFWGLVDEKDTCVRGKINMIGTSYIMKKMATAEKVLKKMGVKDSVVLASSNISSFNKRISTQKISSKQGVSISAVSGKCMLKIWDDGIVDGDMVSVKLNGVLILHEYILQKNAKSIGLTLLKGENTIEIVALNTGDRFPNTAYLSLEDADSKTKLSSNLEKDQTAKIVVVY